MAGAISKPLTAQDSSVRLSGRQVYVLAPRDLDRAGEVGPDESTLTAP